MKQGERIECIAETDDFTINGIYYIKHTDKVNRLYLIINDKKVPHWFTYENFDQYFKIVDIYQDEVYKAYLFKQGKGELAFDGKPETLHKLLQKINWWFESKRSDQSAQFVILKSGVIIDVVNKPKS